MKATPAAAARAAVLMAFTSCASLPASRWQGQGAGIEAQVDGRVEAVRRDTVNGSSLFWALVINNVLIALGLPIIGGLYWYKRRQMQRIETAQRVERD